MDVHKSFVVACVASTNDHGVTTYRSGRFSTFTGDLRRLAAWLHAHSCTDVCMESTGKYRIPVYNILESSCRITLAHSKYVKAIRGKKIDKKDAKWIADIFKHGLVCGSFIPPADIRQLRDLMRCRAKLTGFSTGEKNRVQNCLTVSNIKLDDVFSDVFGKTASAITQRLLEKTLDLILTVPGIQVFAAIGILSEIGADMSVFQSSKHLCSWAGLTPQNNESAGKKKTTRISRAGAYIKPLLVQCALCAIRKKSNPEIRSRYLNLKKRRGHKKAIIAIARMLLTAIYNIIKRNEKYNPALYRKADTPPRNREVSVNEAIYILQRQGYLVTAPQSA